MRTQGVSHTLRGPQRAAPTGSMLEDRSSATWLTCHVTACSGSTRNKSSGGHWGRQPAPQQQGYAQSARMAGQEHPQPRPLGLSPGPRPSWPGGRGLRLAGTGPLLPARKPSKLGPVLRDGFEPAHNTSWWGPGVSSGNLTSM